MISLRLGDTAPPLLIKKWIKGSPISSFQGGKIYVLEFWATWCGPCIAAMPHLSALAAKYKNKVVFIGVNAFEKKTTDKVKAFVDSLGERMSYHVGVEDSSFMADKWMMASGQSGIPATFVVDADNKLAWIGHPSDLDNVLAEILQNSWNIKAASAKRDYDRYLQKLDAEMNDTLNTFAGDAYKQDYYGKPESALLFIDVIVQKEPALKYAPFVSAHTFSALLKTNPRAAYEFGNITIRTATYDDPNFHLIIEKIRWYSDKFTLSPEIYKLGAEAHEVKLKFTPYPDLINMVKLYKTMAEWYWLANDQSKAINAQEKAIDALKNRKNFSASEMAVLEARLQAYGIGRPKN